MAVVAACLCVAPAAAQGVALETKLASNDTGSAAAALTGRATQTTSAAGNETAAPLSPAHTNPAAAVMNRGENAWSSVKWGQNSDTLPAKLGPIVTPPAAPVNPNFVQPGALENMRKQLLEQIQTAEKRGVGVQAYRSEFQKLNKMVAEDASEEDIKKQVISIVTSLHAQMHSSNRAKNTRQAILRQPRQLTKETILAPAQEKPW